MANRLWWPISSTNGWHLYGPALVCCESAQPVARRHSPHLVDCHLPTVSLNESTLVPIPVKCVACGADYSVQDDKAGRKFRCKYCEAIVEVPPAVPPPIGGMPSSQADPFTANSPRPSVAPGGFDSNSGGYANVDPYAPVPPGSGPPARPIGPPPESRVQMPAIFLIVFSSISIPFGLLMGFAQLAQGPGGGPPEEVITGMIFMAVWVLLNVVVLLGGINLLKLKNKALAMTGAIIACVPVCGPCCIAGLPFGIWALIVMNEPDVSRSFKS